MDSTKKTARQAGILYFFLGLIAPVALVIVPNQLIVFENTGATANNIRNSEALFRIGIACQLISQVIVIFLVLVLYRLFKPVNERLSKQLVVLGALVSVPIAFANELNHLAALVLVKRPVFLDMFDEDQLNGVTYFFIRMHGLGIMIISIFWGLWLFPFGLLVIRSGFIPKVFGILLIVAGVAYVVSSFTALLLPQYKDAVNQVASILQIAEVPIIFWLLIWGARTKSSPVPIP